MRELARSLGLTTEALAHLAVAREVGMEHLDDERALQGSMRRVVHMRHATAPQAPRDAVAATHDPPEHADLVVRFLHRHRRQLWELLAAPGTGDGARAIPGSAVGAKHLSAPEIHVHEIVRGERAGQLDAQVRLRTR